MKNVALPSTSAISAASFLLATLGAEHVEPLEPEALVVDRVRELVGEGDPVERRGRFGAHELQLAVQVS